VDLAYATTGHRAQGLTRGRALVRLTGSEDVTWLYVQLSRARQDTRLYAVVGPEPQGSGELDLPDREQPDGNVQLAQALSRAGGQRLAIDTSTSLDLRQLSTVELRAERDRLRRQLDQAPRDRARELARATVHRQHAEQTLAAHQQPTDHQPTGMLRWLRRGVESPGSRVGRRWPPSRPTALMTGSESCASTSTCATAGWRPTPTSARSIARLCEPWPGSAAPPAWPSKPTVPAMSWRRWGPVPESTRGRRAWRHAAAEIEHYRHTYGITDSVRALGPEPADRAQRADRQHARAAIARIHAKQRAADRAHQRQPTSEHTSQARPKEQRGRPGPEWAAG
jgi:hypothetical protein